MRDQYDVPFADDSSCDWQRSDAATFAVHEISLIFHEFIPSFLHLVTFLREQADPVPSAILARMGSVHWC